jgi:hypothetical protein
MVRTVNEPAMKKRIGLLGTLAFLWICGEMKANSAETPAIVVLVKCAPEDLQLAFRIEGAIHEDHGGKRDTFLVKPLGYHRTAWETRFVYYRYRDFDFTELLESGSGTVKLIASSSEKTFEVPLPLKTVHRHYFTLDIEKQMLTEGQTAGRIILPVSLRVCCTLLIEGGVFFLLGFRLRRSWIAFLIINLLTQGTLNLSLTMITFDAFSHSFFFLTVFEIIVFLTEAPAFALALKEHGIARRLLYVLLANLLSFILGGFLINCLPI